MTILRHACAIALAVTVLWAMPTAAAPASLAFTVLKDGKPIGEESYTFDDDPDGALTVEVRTRTDVQVLFLSFHYDHQRTEVWENGVLTRMTAKTDDDGPSTRLRWSARMAAIG